MGGGILLRIMGLDVGDATIGIAVSDELGLIAQAISTIRRKTTKEDLQSLGNVIDEKNIIKVVIGFPKNMNNTIGERGNKTLEFAEILKEAFPNLEIILWDERLTTVAAEKALLEANISRRSRKKVIDKIAAVLILQNYLDAQKNK